MSEIDTKRYKQNMSGYEVCKSIYEVCMERSKKIKDLEYSKKDEEVAKNLETFKEKYNKMKESELPLYEDGSPHNQYTIFVNIKEMYSKDTVVVIRDFLKEEKWPDNKVYIYETYGYITVSLIFN